MVFSVNTTLDSAVKFCPVRIICWPPYTRQLSMSCLSTMGSSWADRWAVGKRMRSHGEGTPESLPDFMLCPPLLPAVIATCATVACGNLTLQIILFL